MPELPKDHETETNSHLTKSEIPKIALIQILCTIAIILAMYAFSNRTILEITQRMETQEYIKVGGEENYRLLQEIQKDQVSSMIRDYSVTNPGYIDQIKKKINSNTSEDSSKKIETKTLTPEEINSLKSQTSIFGYTGALVSLIEFSDFTCEHCQDFHNKKILSELESSSSGTINYIFKNIPSRKNQEGIELATLGKCAHSLSGSIAFSQYIDEVFSAQGVNKQSLNSSGALGFTVTTLGIDEERMRACRESADTKSSLEREFGQSIYLGIKVAPSLLVLNSKTGTYQIIEGNVDEIQIQTAIDEIVKN